MNKYVIPLLSVILLTILSLGLVACRATRGPDGTITIESIDGKTRKLPPEKVKKITINGVCYIQFETPQGTYCIPCEFEDEAYAEPCDSLIGAAANALPAPDPYSTFSFFLDELLAQEGVARNSSAIMAAYEDMCDPVRRGERAELCRRLDGTLAISRHVDELLSVYREICEETR